MDKIQIIEKLFYYIVTYSYLILPLTYLIIRPRRRESLLIGIYGVVAFCMLLAYEKFLPRHLRPAYFSTYTAIEYCFFSYFIFLNILSKTYRRTIIVASILFIGFQIIYFFTGSFRRVDSIPIGVETILLIIFITFLFHEYFKNLKPGIVSSNPSFWIAVGILIYLGGSFFFNILVEHIDDKDQLMIYLNLSYIPETIKNVFFSIAIGYFSRKPIISKNKFSDVPHLDMI